MKLLYLANLRLPTEKAYGIQIAKMCEAFANAMTNDNNIEVALVVPYRKNKIKDDFFDYYDIERNFKFKRIWVPDFYWPGFFDKISFLIKNYLSARSLVKEALKENWDIYYTRDERIAYILSKKNKNVIFECHRFSRSRKRFYPHLKKIVAISDGLKDDLIKSGVNNENILIARDGVDIEKFNLTMSKEEARKRVDLPLDRKIVMYTGHLFEWKGATSLLEVARKPQTTNHKPQTNNEEILFVFVGGTEYDLKKFREKARGLDNVLILGHKPYKDIPLYLKAADILVLPNSAKEKAFDYTSPLKLFEYMSSKRPIVASDLPALGEVLNDNNAVLVVPNNPDMLAEGIRKIVSKADLGDSISHQAFNDVQKYTWQKRADRIISFAAQE